MSTRKCFSSPNKNFSNCKYRYRQKIVGVLERSLVVIRGHSWSFVITRGHSCVLLDTIQFRRNHCYDVITLLLLHEIEARRSNADCDIQRQIKNFIPPRNNPILVRQILLLHSHSVQETIRTDQSRETVKTEVTSVWLQTCRVPASACPVARGFLPFTPALVPSVGNVSEVFLCYKGTNQLRLVFTIG